MDQAADLILRLKSNERVDLSSMEQQLFELVASVDKGADSSLQDEGATRVAQALEHNSTLTSLDIGGMDQLQM